MSQQPTDAVAPPPLPRVVSAIALMLTFGFMLAIGAIVAIRWVPGNNTDSNALWFLIGVLSCIEMTIVCFCFGSSLGSWTKNPRVFPPLPGPVPVPVPDVPKQGPIPLPPPPLLPGLPLPRPVTPQPPAPSKPSEPPPAVKPTPPVGDVTGIGHSTNPGTASIRSDVAPDGRVASIRYCNPGAQYPSAEAAAFGQLGYGMIGGGHKIARFPHPVNGAASNMELLSRAYTGMTVAAAGDKWTGGNGHGIPGYPDDMMLTKDMVADPKAAIAIMTAIAAREAGRPGTLTDQQWSQAHDMFLAGSADAWLAGGGATKPGNAPVTQITSSAPIYATWATDMDAGKIKAIQSALSAKGFDPGDIDGEYGDDTASAVSAFQQANGLTVDGEVGPETAAALGVDLSSPVSPTQPSQPQTSGAFAGAPPWFVWALHEIGTKEDPDNTGPAIQRYIDLAHAGAQHDPWCAIFANAALEANGIKGTRSASSQSFRSSDDFVKLSGPSLGAISVFWRGSESSGLGHVGFYRGEAGDRLWILGGNEGDMVQIEAFPRSSSSFGLIGYWWPKSVALPAIGAIQMPSGSPTSVKTEPKVT